MNNEYICIFRVNKKNYNIRTNRKYIGGNRERCIMMWFQFRSHAVHFIYLWLRLRQVNFLNSKMSPRFEQNSVPTEDVLWMPSEQETAVWDALWHAVFDLIAMGNQVESRVSQYFRYPLFCSQALFILFVFYFQRLNTFTAYNITGLLATALYRF